MKIWTPVLAALIVSLCAAATAATPGTSVLFDEPHLSNVEPGTTLTYSFTHEASREELGADFKDVIEITLTESEEEDAGEGALDAEVMLFTGERHRAAGPFTGMTGNPVLMLFLEYDVLEMNRYLQGNDFYLRNRIKDAMRVSEAKSVTVTYEGEEVDGWKVAFEPFTKEHDKRGLSEFTGKRYEVVIAGEVPGGIYEITTLTPAAEGGEPLVADTLRFSGVETGAQ